MLGNPPERCSMTYYEAALKILESAQQPLTTQEVTDRAISQGLVVPHGKTPVATMSAVLYEHLGIDGRLVKSATSGPTRAKRGTVRWALRKTADATA